MRFKHYLTKGSSSVLMIISIFFLSSCGGSSSSLGVTNTDNHPIFYRAKATDSPSYYPTGNISETNPSFSWKAINNATEYHFGHEGTLDSSEWHSYRVSPSEVNCQNVGDTCEYTPTDYTFPLSVEKVWWVRAKINGEWQDWSRPIIFTVVDNGGGGGGNNAVSTPLAPLGNINTTSPEFSWTGVSGALKYKIGIEDANTGEGWQTKIVWADDAGCESSQTCTQTLYNMGLNQGQKVAWWVKAEVNGEWGDWSETGAFNITQSQTTRPFIVKIDPHKTFCVGTNCQTTNVFTINTLGSGYNYAVDCESDGVLEGTNITGPFSCSYNTIGQHRVTISGVFPQIYQLKAVQSLEVEQWGNQKWRSMESAFEYSGNLIISASDIPDLSNVSSMKRMFYGIRKNTFNNIENWDVSHVKDMSDLFSMSTFNQDISAWDVSHVTNMHGMFRGYINGSAWFRQAFNQDISQWDVSHVTNMSSMFSASSFDKLIDRWDVSSVTDMSSMFKHSVFNQPINSWDVHNVVSMHSMFESTKIFNQDISNWQVGSVTNMSSMFSSAVAFNQDISAWDVSNVTNMNSMFFYSTVFNQDISLWDVSHVTDMLYMFGSTTAFNQDISNWQVGNVTDMRGMFSLAVAFNQDLSPWDISHVEYMNQFFIDTNLSLHNYDNMLIAWSRLNLKHGVLLEAGNTKYSASAVAARDRLINTFSWTITDGGQL